MPLLVVGSVTLFPHRHTSCVVVAVVVSTVYSVVVHRIAIVGVSCYSTTCSSLLPTNQVDVLVVVVAAAFFAFSHYAHRTSFG